MQQYIKGLFILILCFIFSACGRLDKTVLLKTSEGDIELLLYGDTPAVQDVFLKLGKTAPTEAINFSFAQVDFVMQAQLADTSLWQGIEPIISPNHFHQKGALYVSANTTYGDFGIVLGQTQSIESLAVINKQYGINFTDSQTNTYLQKGGLPHLDGTQMVFGEIADTASMAIVEKIAAKLQKQADAVVTASVVKSTN